MSGDLKVIKTGEDYRNAIQMISTLMDQNPPAGSKEFDLMETLAVLIEKYEKEAFDLGSPDPIEAIKLRMNEKGLRQRDLVALIGSPVKVSEVLNRKRALTFDMMKALSEALDIPAEVFFNYDRDSMPATKSEIESRVPIKEIVKKNWLDFSGDIREIANKSRQLLDRFFSDQGSYELAFSTGAAYKRQLIRKGANIDSVSLSTWLYMVLKLASGVTDLKPYRSSALSDDALARIRGFSKERKGPQKVRDYLHSLGIILVILPHLKKTHIDGAAIMMPNRKNPIIALTLRYDRVDNFWFCLFHELGHIYHHINQELIIAEDLDHIDHSDVCEREADAFAKEWLIPEKSWNVFFKDGEGDFSPDSVMEYANEIGINPAIVAGRIRHQKNRWTLLSRMVGHNEVRKIFGDEYYSRS